MDSLQGQLLIASPGLADPNFARTVILIAVHGDDGALGLILNRELNTPLPQIWSQVSEAECLRAENVRHGGPISGSLMAIHDQRPHANLVVTEDIYVATELNAMESLAGSEQGAVLFYVGHSGWGPASSKASWPMARGSCCPPPPNTSSAPTTPTHSGETPSPKPAGDRCSQWFRSSTYPTIRGSTNHPLFRSFGATLERLGPASRAPASRPPWRASSEWA